LSFWWNLHPKIQVNLNKPYIFTLFFIFLFSCWAPMLVHEWWRGFLFFTWDMGGVFIFHLGYGYEKHESYKNLVSMLIHGGLIFRVWLNKGSQNDKKNDIRKIKWKHMRG
jgi:hypothetical protein